MTMPVPLRPMPVLFVGHGNPMNAVQDNPWSRGFRALSDGLGRPGAVLAVSAHWTSQGTQVTGQDRPRTIHDFGGFPQELYRVDYPAPGHPDLARRVAALLRGAPGGDAPARGLDLPRGTLISHDWGLDHGTWSVLRHIFPKADIPVVQLSLDASATPDRHWAVGAALRPLREEGVLIVASGNLVHNLGVAFRKMRTGDTRTESWSLDFDERVARGLDANDRAALLGALDDDVGRLAHPTHEHYHPILYAAAAAGRSNVTFPIEGFDMGDVSMRAVRFDAA